MIRSKLARYILLGCFLSLSRHALSLEGEKVWLGAAPPADEIAQGEVKSPGPKSVANGLVMEGNISFNKPSGSSVVTLSVETITNNSGSRSTGTLRLELWATLSRPSRGGSLSGYRLAVGPQLSPLQPNFHYSNVVQTTSFSAPPDGTYWMTVILAEFDSNNCSQSDFFCVSDSLTFSSQNTFGNAPPPPPPPPPQLTSGSTAKTLASRGTVSGSATLFGGFELLVPTNVLLLVRGNSLGTLGVTQGYMDAPRVRIYNQQGADLVSQNGMPGFNACVASNAVTDYPVLYYYSAIRQAPADSRDSCYASTFPAGIYSFSITPSILGVNSNNLSSSRGSGEVLFEITLFR